MLDFMEGIGKGDFMKERMTWWISGEVQGVGFRYYTRSLATRFEVDGWVMNLADGRVQVTAEGETQELERFLTAIQEGQLGPNIGSVEGQKEKARGLPPGFQIHFGDQ
jgi:acylphosphatase